MSGANGSGKSAVLQAIQQVLGVRASATNRASTQKEFIRKGAHEALISVTLWNKGEDAYQPEKWGNFITIDRRIGNSCSWSMKDAKYVTSLICACYVGCAQCTSWLAAVKDSLSRTPHRM